MSVFIDTNVLVYLFDADAPEKQAKARELYAELALTGRALLSTQVLQEFYVTVTRKLGVPLPAEQAEQIVEEFTQLPLVQVDGPMVLRAIARHRRHQHSFWDALIIEAALSAGAERLLSEDLQHGRTVDGIRIENPFLDA